jgi:hypothetical protein
MITITKKLKRNNFQPQTFRVYTKAEAKGKGLKWKHWGEAKEGEYGISDDGYVAECIYRKVYGEKVEYTYPYGRQWLTAWGKLEFEPHWKSNNFSTVSTKSYNDLEVQKKGADIAMDAYIAYKMAGLSPDWEKIGRLYRPDQDNPVIAAKRLFKTKQVKKMIQDKLKDILIDKNIDEGFVLDVIKDAIEVAKVKEDSGNMIRAAKELSEFLDMKPKTKQVTESLEMDMSHQIADSYETQTKKLKATQTRQLDEENNNHIGEDTKSD